MNLDVSLNAENKMFVRHKNFGNSHSFSVTSSVAGILSKDANIAQLSHSGKNIEGTINGEMALGDGQLLTAIKGSEAEGVTIKYDKELGFNEVFINDATFTYDHDWNKEIFNRMIDEKIDLSC